MAEESEKTKKGGAGKFFLGAALGAAAGFIASKFVSANMKKDGGEEIEEGDACECNERCTCDKKEETAECDEECACDKKEKTAGKKKEDDKTEKGATKKAE